MMFPWKKIGGALKKTLLPIAPTLASVMGGPLAGMAVATLAGELGVEVPEGAKTADVESQIIAKLETATEDGWLRVKEAENTFKIKLRELEIDEEKVLAMDRDSARKMQVQVRSKMPGFLAVVTLIAFCGTLGALLYMGAEQIIIEQNLTATIGIVLGVLLSSMKSIYNYYFGSSEGSKRKTEIIGNGR
jgi:hypothetical protein